MTDNEALRRAKLRFGYSAHIQKSGFSKTDPKGSLSHTSYERPDRWLFSVGYIGAWGEFKRVGTGNSWEVAFADCRKK